jgi:monoamine oxidase
MPKRSLELILPGCPVLANSSGTFPGLLNSVVPIPLYKLFIRYPDAWWRATGVCRGQSLTDTPIRQCWYWTESQQAKCGGKESEAVLMVYNDALSVEFWGGLRPFALANSIEGCRLQPQAEDDDARLRDNWNSHSAPTEMVAEMHRQLLTLHNVRSAPEPVQAVYVDWSDDPFGAGVHIWNRGAQSWRVLEDMTQPVPDFPCYICGEAYSTVQTWVEGALQSAEIVLQKRLHLTSPAWLDA